MFLRRSLLIKDLANLSGQSCRRKGLLQESHVGFLYAVPDQRIIGVAR
jgi:hypothetical protein